MTKTFTQDDIIRYLYKETSEVENRELENALICDADLLDLYKRISAVIRQLDKCMKEPSEKVTQNILNYSKSINLHSTKK